MTIVDLRMLADPVGSRITNRRTSHLRAGAESETVLTIADRLACDNDLPAGGNALQTPRRSRLIASCVR
jgi:hypothetical protein